MALLALTTLSLLVAFPQGEPDDRFKPTLSSTDLKGLNRKAQAWIPAMMNDTGGKRLRKKQEKAKGSFMKAFDAKSKKAPLLKELGDLLAIFDNVFPYKRIPTSGEMKIVTPKASNGGGAKYGLLAPKRYDFRKKYSSVLVLPGLNDKKEWATPKEYLDLAWKGTKSHADMLFVIPTLRKDDYDAKPDLATNEGQEGEHGRIGSVLIPLGEVQRRFHLDRRRVFLDCGVGNSAFGLRLATYFPDRFAGVILRSPVLPADLLLESLIRVPLLLISTDETAKTCDKILKEMDLLEPNFVTIVGGEGAAPYSNAAEEIDKWIRKQARQLFPFEVRIAPNHDFFHKSHWVEIIGCEPLESVGTKKAKRPYVKVKAEKDKNRIIITTVAVSELGLFLNDSFVDLDKEVVFVVNGKEIKGNTFPRSMKTLTKYLQRRYDPTFLYPAYYRFEVPKAEAKDK